MQDIYTDLTEGHLRKAAFELYRVILPVAYEVNHHVENTISEMSAVGEILVEGVVNKLAESVNSLHPNFEAFEELNVINAVFEDLIAFYASSSDREINSDFVDESLNNHGVNTQNILETAINETIIDFEIQKDLIKQQILNNMSMAEHDDINTALKLSQQIDDTFEGVQEQNIEKLKELFTVHKKEILSLCQQYRQNKQSTQNVINIDNVLRLADPFYLELQNILDKTVVDFYDAAFVFTEHLMQAGEFGNRGISVVMDEWADQVKVLVCNIWYFNVF